MKHLTIVRPSSAIAYLNCLSATSLGHNRGAKFSILIPIQVDNLKNFDVNLTSFEASDVYL